MTSLPDVLATINKITGQKFIIIIDEWDSLIQSYWSMTGTYESILPLINMGFEGLRTDIIRMLSGGTVKMDISSFQNDMVTFKDKDDILTALVHLGYLAYNEKERGVFIPNEEIRSEFAKAVKRKKWNEMEVMQEMNKDEIKIIKNSTIYEIRLMLDVDDKETYTKDEILKLLDTIARAKESEQIDNSAIEEACHTL